MKTKRLGLALAALLASPASAEVAPPPLASLSPAACRITASGQTARHVDRAYRLVGRDLPQGLIPNLFIFPRSIGLCPPPRVPVVTIDNTVVAPIKAFDQLTYVGDKFVGSWVLRTSAGLILFDTMWNESQARDIIEQGIRSEGMDPAKIRFIIISHGHADHIGGAKYLQDKYGAQVLVGAPDVALLALPSAPGMPVPPPPRVDRDIHDGDTLTLGDTTVKFYLTPGHTPGAVSAVFPVTTNGRRHIATIFGGFGMPIGLEPDHAHPPRSAGLLAYVAQVRRFREIGRKAGAEIALSTHPIFDDTVTKGALAGRTATANPWVLGKHGWLRFSDAIIEIALAVESMERETKSTGPNVR